MSAKAHPPIVSRKDWLQARKDLLAEEKEHTKRYDRLNARRRRLPMVALEKPYAFQGPDGPLGLQDLFGPHPQLIVYHFMFDPEWDKGCTGCTGLVDALGDLSLLAKRNTAFALVSRAPLEKLERYKQERGWTWPWVSSFESDFNYDFHATLDETVAPVQYNYRSRAELEQRQGGEPSMLRGEAHGYSVFFRLGETLHHSYSTYARGCESVTDAYRLLDLTPYGRQEDFEDSPEGWPQRPTYG